MSQLELLYFGEVYKHCICHIRVVHSQTAQKRCPTPANIHMGNMRKRFFESHEKILETISKTISVAKQKTCVFSGFYIVVLMNNSLQLPYNSDMESHLWLGSEYLNSILSHLMKVRRVEKQSKLPLVIVSR